MRDFRSRAQAAGLSGQRFFHDQDAIVFTAGLCGRAITMPCYLLVVDEPEPLDLERALDWPAGLTPLVGVSRR